MTQPIATVTMTRVNWTWLLAAVVEQLTEQVEEAQAFEDAFDDGDGEALLRYQSYAPKSEEAGALLEEARRLSQTLLPILWWASDRGNPEFETWELLDDFLQFTGFVVPQQNVDAAKKLVTTIGETDG